ACGPEAVLSHQDAAALWGFRPGSSPRIHVTARRSRGPQPGLKVHRTRGLTSEDVAIHRSIPTTSVARTLLDLGAVLAPGDLESAVGRALQQRLVDAVALESVIARGNGHRGSGKLARVLAHEPKATKSELERVFLALIRRAGLPEPETNVWMTFGAGEEWQIDALWRREQVSVELDSWRYHQDRRSFEADRLRAATLTAAGYRHLQITWRQLTTDAPTVVRTLRALLQAGGPTFPG
ncbi:MAG TPA: hypothetical protein VHB30_11280, partial [Solirubrobacteraceae bacterium]|nr:hypothetical protein [Solirubrobacteraceae bacterium]